MKWIIVSVFLLLFTATRSLAQCPSTTPLRIEDVQWTNSRCENSGTIQAIVSGGTAPYLFHLSSSTTNTSSTNGQFAALAPGTYLLRVTDRCNEQQSQSVIIARTYEPLQLSAITLSPTCPAAADGSLEITVQHGRAPFRYSLITPSEVTRSAQASNTFTNLPAGNYTYQVEDSCGNFQTRTAIIQNNNDFRVNMISTEIVWMSCTRYSINFYINADAGADASAPYELIFTLPDGSSISRTVANTGTLTSGSIDFDYQHLHGTPPIFTLAVTNGCGVQRSKQVTIPFNMEAIARPGSCGTGYDYVFDDSRDNSTGSIYHLRGNAISYTLLSPTGSVLATQLNNSLFKGYPPGNGYKVVREDCSGRNDTIQFNWSAAVPMTLTAFPSPADKVGTATIDINTNTGVPGTLVILSGPPSISFSDGSSIPYSFPEKIEDIEFLPGRPVKVGYFAPGNYTLRFTDTCGNHSSANLVISAAHPRHIKKMNFDAGMVQGCINANKIWYKGTNNHLADNLRLTGAANRSISLPLTYEDTIRNLTQGNYQLSYVFNPNASPTFKLNAHAGVGADIIVRNFQILPYRSPRFHAKAAVTVCNDQHNFAVLPDYDFGIEPFQFAITSGPVTSAAQSSPAFANLPSGLYSIRMSDHCGNSYSSQLSITAPSLPVLSVIDETCNNSYITIIPENVESGYYSYTWEYPDGRISWNKDLLLDPFLPSDIGSYKLTIASNVEGCYNTLDTIFDITGCSVLPVHFLDFSVSARDQQHLLRWSVADLQPQQFFIVQRSRDGMHFSDLTRIYPEEGTRNFTRLVPASGQPKDWYRIAIMEDDRSIVFSKIAGTGSTNQNNLLISPNPVSGGQVLIQLPASRSAGSLCIFDMMGKQVLHKQTMANARFVEWNITRLPAGCYQMVFLTPESKHMARFIKR